MGLIPSHSELHAAGPRAVNKEISDQTPESFAAIFFYSKCIFVNLHSPNSASELEVTAQTLKHVTSRGGTFLPPKLLRGNVHERISQVLEVKLAWMPAMQVITLKALKLTLPVTPCTLEKENQNINKVGNLDRCAIKALHPVGDLFLTPPTC